MAKSIIGFHYSLGGNKTGITQFMERLNAAGIPFLMKGVDDAGVCFEAQQIGARFGVANHLIYRVSTNGQKNGIEYDVPDYTKPPKAAAQEHWVKTVAKWPPELDKTAVWMEPINEPRAKLSPDDVQYDDMPPVAWLGWFMLEYAKIANSYGYKVCGPSFNAGEPEVFSVNDYAWPGMIAYMRYCAENPDKAGLSVHEYIWDMWQTHEWNDFYPSHWGRVEAAIAAADNDGIPRTFPIFMTEWGFALDNAPRWEQAEPFITAYNQWAARWPQVKGVASWTLQMGWGNVSDDVQTWFAPLADYAVSRDFPAGAQPARTQGAFGGTLPGSSPPPPDETLDEYLVRIATEAQLTHGIRWNVDSALGKAISAAKLYPMINEVNGRYNDTDYVVQVAEHPRDVKQRYVYVCKAGQQVRRIHAPVGGQPEPPPDPVPPPAGDKIDLLPYLAGDGRLYEVRNANGGQERFQTQHKLDGEFWQTKNGLAEMLFATDLYIWRDWDTSPGNGRYYRLKNPANNQNGTRWMPRRMQVGESFTVQVYVQFFNWNCQPVNENSGHVTDTRKLVAHHATWTSRAGITLSDVIEIEWSGGERYFYGRGFGLVGWERSHQDPHTPQWSAIAEIHAPGQRPDNVVDLPSCLSW